MMKSHNKLITVLLTIILAACSTPPVTTPPSTPVAEVTTTSSLVATPVPVIVTLVDPVLDAMVRGSMGKIEGDITLAEAQAVTRMNFSNELQSYISAEAPIKDLNGLENFTNLEILDLSNHVVTDISPLAGLTKLTTLSLAGNPVADVTPLAGLTDLQFLILSGSQAQEYSALSNLINLQVLMLDHSTISDLTPLAGLTNLRQLYLANSSIEDLSPLETIYPNLEEKDFIIATTLAELGFNLDFNSHQAFFDGEDVSFTIHHVAWGSPPEGWFTNTIRTSMYTESGYKVLLGYYGDLDAYVFMFHKDGEQLVNYVYDAPSGDINISEEDRANIEQVVRAAFEVMEGEDPLLAPMRIFHDTVKDTFGMTPAKLYALPYAPPNLKNLGFYADEPNAVYLYEYRGESILDDVNMEVHRPEWGEKEFDVRFFTPISNEYRIVITWHAADRKFIASVDDNSQGGGSFEYFIDTGEHQDIWCSYKDKTVEEYFTKAYNDPAIEDVYQHSVDLMVQYIRDTFGMTIEELYSLPTGE
ncbi:leucine-rich repeat domain-containing protein [Ornatilinea apprima]|uniref:leucine-rich repeat domain-containing protein n=1 Tax=Ornatilinea apprima TaxID=1134406 RepID=UPI000AE2ECEC|nr:leucine-rich repeat domain-containing protein [Ornatilinea apprima]